MPRNLGLYWILINIKKVTRRLVLKFTLRVQLTAPRHEIYRCTCFSPEHAHVCVCVCVCVVSCTLFIDINMHTNFVLLLQQQQLSGCLDLYAVGHLLQCTLTIIPQICY